MKSSLLKNLRSDLMLWLSVVGSGRAGDPGGIFPSLPVWSSLGCCFFSGWDRVAIHVLWAGIPVLALWLVSLMWALPQSSYGRILGGYGSDSPSSTSSQTPLLPALSQPFTAGVSLPSGQPSWTQWDGVHLTQRKPVVDTGFSSAPFSLPCMSPQFTRNLLSQAQ